MGVKCFEFGVIFIVNVLDILVQIQVHFENSHETFCMLVYLYREGSIWMFPISDRRLDAQTFPCACSCIETELQNAWFQCTVTQEFVEFLQ